MFFYFFFNDTATTEIYTLSLHDALPISFHLMALRAIPFPESGKRVTLPRYASFALHDQPGNTMQRLQTEYTLKGIFLGLDRKSTRLNSSHTSISYPVFSLKKKHITFTQS